MHSRPGRAPELTEASGLADYLAYAALNNPSLEAAFNGWRAAVERVPQVRALPDPARAWRLQWLTQVLLANFAARREMDRRLRAMVRQRREYEWIQDVPYTAQR